MLYDALVLGLGGLTAVCAYLSVNIGKGKDHSALSLFFLGLASIFLVGVVHVSYLSVQVDGGVLAKSDIATFYGTYMIPYVIYIPVLLIVYFVVLFAVSIFNSLLNRKQERIEDY